MLYFNIYMDLVVTMRVFLSVAISTPFILIPFRVLEFQQRPFLQEELTGAIFLEFSRAGECECLCMVVWLGIIFVCCMFFPSDFFSSYFSIGFIFSSH